MAYPKQFWNSFDSGTCVAKFDTSVRASDSELLSLRTGRRVPSSIAIPTLRNLTYFNYTAPCNSEAECSDWVCGNLLQNAVMDVTQFTNPSGNAVAPGLVNDSSFDNISINSSFDGTSSPNNRRRLEKAKKLPVLLVASTDGGFDAFNAAWNSGFNTAPDRMVAEMTVRGLSVKPSEKTLLIVPVRIQDLVNTSQKSTTTASASIMEALSRIVVWSLALLCLLI